MGIFLSALLALVSPFVGQERIVSLGKPDAIGWYLTRVSLINFEAIHFWLVAWFLVILWLLRCEIKSGTKSTIFTSVVLVTFLVLVRFASLGLSYLLAVWYGTFWIGFVLALLIAIAWFLVGLFFTIILSLYMTLPHARQVQEDSVEKLTMRDNLVLILVLVILFV